MKATVASHSAAISSAAPQVRATCPRCGYDLRGAVATWDDSCPLTGTCAECGLEFDWADVLRADRNGPRWCIEYEKYPRRVPRAAVRTFLRSFWPWGFWRDLQMHHDVRSRRLAAYGVFLLAPLLLCYVIVQSSVAIHVRWWQAQQLRQQQAMRPGQLAMMQQRVTLLEQNAHPSYKALSDEERAVIIARLKSWIARYQQSASSRGGVDFPYVFAVLEAVFFPFGNESWGAIVDPVYGPQPYPPPRRLWSMMAPGRVATGNTLAPVVIAIVFGTFAVIIFPLTLVLLPITRRRCRVRWSHIFRAAIYSLFIPITTIACCAVLVALVLMYAITEPIATAAAFTLPWLLLILWWSAALRRYLRIPHAEVTVIIHAIMVFLFIPAFAVMLERIL